MSRFKQINDPRDNPRLVALYREMVESGMGSQGPLNWYTAQSERPDILEATWSLTKGILLGGQIPAVLKQMIVLSISARNDCRYCKVLHTSALKAMGVPMEIIDCLTTDINFAKLPPQQRDVLLFALKVAKDAGAVADEDIRTLQRHGLSSGEIMEVAMVAAFANFINTWADVSRVSIDALEISP